MKDLTAQTPSALKFSGYQKFLIGILAFLQFTIVLDFMIISPLGAIVMPALRIDPKQFGLVVSAYAFSAGASGLLAAGFADRFDRKKLLLFFYCGFILGTGLCGIAATYPLLLFARVVTGLFGGVIGSVVLAITTDLFPLEMRGRVMGFIQTAFGASQILGIPAGLYFATWWNWHAPFLMIVIVATLVGVMIVAWMRPVDAHLHLKQEHSPVMHLVHTVGERRYLLAFVTTMLIATGGYMIMPFGSAFVVNNIGISLDRLPLLYLITGLCTIFCGPLIGKATDRFGKLATFVFGTALSAVMIVIYTNLGHASLPVVVAINVAMFVGIFARIIPSQALMTAIPDVTKRGAFNSVSASLQQVSGGVASVLAGLIVMQMADGRFARFDVLGYVVVVAYVLTLAFMVRINKMVAERTKAADQPAETGLQLSE